MRKIVSVTPPPSGHWVGDGFPVRSLFSPDSHGDAVSPFLLLDYGGPAEFAPTAKQRGVGTHPHRGFETVTIVYDGAVAHRDSTGAGGEIGPGDVQWMTAASGILHQEFHAPAFARTGGRFEMAQLWVNLPAKDKMAAPGYQNILAADIPAVDLPDDAGSVHVIAGAYDGHAGPARTFTPIDVWDVRLNAGKSAQFTLPAGHTLNLAVFSGPVKINGEVVADKAQFVTFSREGGDVLLEAEADSKILLLSGAPIEEPVAAYGPFVMNTEDEIRQAFADFRAGRFGAIA
ncbi:MAG TPA: pirin family protein [Rhodoblastus sp.]|nr:pirin family protein [Rhodoblastus sp.]